MLSAHAHSTNGMVEEKRWYDEPQGTLEAVRCLLAYVPKGAKKQALTKRAMFRAARLICLHGEKGTWVNSVKRRERRLMLVGLDGKGNVVDEVRWAHAMDYFRDQETFRENDFRRWLETHPEPSAVPAVSVPVRPHPRSRARREEREREELVSRRLSDLMREKYF